MALLPKFTVPQSLLSNDAVLFLSSKEHQILLQMIDIFGYQALYDNTITLSEMSELQGKIVNGENMASEIANAIMYLADKLNVGGNDTIIQCCGDTSALTGIDNPVTGTSPDTPPPTYTGSDYQADRCASANAIVDIVRGALSIGGLISTVSGSIVSVGTIGALIASATGGELVGGAVVVAGVEILGAPIIAGLAVVIAGLSVILGQLGNSIADDIELNRQKYVCLVYNATSREGIINGLETAFLALTLPVAPPTGVLGMLLKYIVTSDVVQNYYDGKLKSNNPNVTSCACTDPNLLFESYVGLAAHPNGYAEYQGVTAQRNNGNPPPFSSIGAGSAGNADDITIPIEFAGRQVRVTISNRDTPVLVGNTGKLELNGMPKYTIQTDDNTPVSYVVTLESGKVNVIRLHSSSGVGLGMLKVELV